MIKHQNVQKFKDTHLGKECVIVGTGPSLNLMDLSFIKHKYFIAVNNFYKHELAEHASLFTVCDDVVWHNHKDQILSKVKVPIFVNTNVLPARSPNLYPVKKLELYRGQEIDLKNGIHKTETVVGTAMMIAYYLGFSKIYLIGCDCNYSKDHHFDGSKVDNYLRTDWNPVFEVYKHMHEYFSKNNREIYNATIGGNLEVFPRKDYKILT